MGRGGARPGGGRPKGSKSYAEGPAYGRPRSATYNGVKARIRELGRRKQEDAKKEKVRLELQLLPYDEPRLQAMELHTTHDLGDSFLQWMKQIDGSTTGIARGTPYRGSVLAFEPPLLVSDESGEDNPIQTELDADDVIE